MDFVTNSSSTSYVVAYKSQPSVDNATITKYPFLAHYYGLLDHVLITEESWHSTSEGCIASTKDELDAYIVDSFGCGGEGTTIDEVVAQWENLQERYDNYAEHIKEGYRILFKCVDNIDEKTTGILNSLAEGNKDFIILEKH